MVLHWTTGVEKPSEVMMRFGAQVRGLQVGGERPDKITVEVSELAKYMIEDRLKKTNTLDAYVSELMAAIRP